MYVLFTDICNLQVLLNIIVRLRLSWSLTVMRRLWVQLSHSGKNYFHYLALVTRQSATLGSATKHAMSRSGGTRRTKCLNREQQDSVNYALSAFLALRAI